METDPTRINQRLLNLPLIGIVALDKPGDVSIVLLRCRFVIVAVCKES
jgi:hypothetical protein